MFIEEFVQWHLVRDPDPRAIPNLSHVAQKLLDADAISPDSTLTIYRISQITGIATSQIRRLVTGRPGFVEVLKGKRGTSSFFYLKDFGRQYPAVYGTRRLETILQKMVWNEHYVPPAATTHMENAAEVSSMIQQMTSPPVAKTYPRIATAKATVQEYIVEAAAIPEVPTEVVLKTLEASLSGDKEATRQMVLLMTALFHSQE